MKTPHLQDPEALLVLVISVILMIATLGLFYLLIFLIVLHIALHTTWTLEDPESVYIVFGKRLTQGKPDKEYRSRLDRLASSKFKTAILTGGISTNESVSEAQAGYQYIQSPALKERTIHFEESARNTLENLKNCRDILGAEQAVVMITSRYHLARCSSLATSLGMSYQLCAAEKKFNLSPSSLVKCMTEAFYLHWFYCGKCWATLTNNQSMLRKIR